MLQRETVLCKIMRSSLIYCTTSFILAHVNFYLITSRDLGQKKNNDMEETWCIIVRNCRLMPPSLFPASARIVYMNVHIDLQVR